MLIQSDGEGDSSDNLDREDSSDDGDLDDGVGNDQLKRQVRTILSTRLFFCYSLVSLYFCRG